MIRLHYKINSRVNVNLIVVTNKKPVIHKERTFSVQNYSF